MKKLILLLLIPVLLTFSGCSHVQPLRIYIPQTLPPQKLIQNIEIALVLGGGGAKSFAHVGALEVLEENGIPIDMIVGTSAGSAIAVLYADSLSVECVKNKVLHIKKWDLLDVSLYNLMAAPISLKGPVTGYSLAKFLNENLTAKTFCALKIPAIAVSGDIHTGEKVAIGSGPVVPAVHASSAIPGIFSPLHIYGHTLVDGGVVEPVPVATAKQYNPKMIIAVDISSKPDQEKVSNMLIASYKALGIAYYQLARLQSMSADIDIHPDLSRFGLFDDHASMEIYEAGKEAARSQIPAILERMEEQGIKRRFRPNADNAPKKRFDL